MITLERYQTEAKEQLSRWRRGLLQAPAGSGKTIMAAAALLAVLMRKRRDRKVRVGWIANTKEQVDQARAALAAFPLIGPLIEATVCCAAGAPEMIGMDIVIVDECHHLPAEQWLETLHGYGGALWLMSATPFGEDEDRNQILRGLCENRIHVVPRSAVKDRVLHGNVVMLSDTDSHDLRSIIDEEIEAALTKRMSRFSVFFPAENAALWTVIARREWTEKVVSGIDGAIASSGGDWMRVARSFVTSDRVKEIDKKLFESVKARNWSQCAYLACMQLGIIPNAARNRAVIRVAKEHVAAGDTVIALIYSITHGEALAEHVPGAVVMHSKMGVKKRREAVAGIRNGDIRCAFATTMLEEGFDAPRANVLIQAGAGRSSRKAEQTTGRVLRAFGDQTHGTIYDFHDTFHPLTAKQSKRRQELYWQLGYSIRNASEIQQPSLI